MNAYDFDKTIYDGDSTVNFYFFCLKKQPQILKQLPRLTYNALKFLFHTINKTQFKEQFYKFLLHIDNVDGMINEFWDINIKKIKKFYIENQKDDDVIISASPYFLLKPICDRLGIKNLIASEVDKHTGKYTGLNCYGREKVERFKKLFDVKEIDEFYSDSYSDSPLACLAKKAYIVKKDKLSNW